MIQNSLCDPNSHFTEVLGGRVEKGSGRSQPESLYDFGNDLHHHIVRPEQFGARGHLQLLCQDLAIFTSHAHKLVIFVGSGELIRRLEQFSGFKHNVSVQHAVVHLPHQVEKSCDFSIVALQFKLPELHSERSLAFLHQQSHRITQDVDVTVDRSCMFVDVNVESLVTGQQVNVSVDKHSPKLLDTTRRKRAVVQENTTSILISIEWERSFPVNKLLIMDNLDQPLHHTLDRQRSTFSKRLRQLHSHKDRCCTLSVLCLGYFRPSFPHSFEQRHREETSSYGDRVDWLIDGTCVPATTDNTMILWNLYFGEEPEKQR
ncbi:uncharacterized protein LOC131446656 [Solea solea]|uniref:uncharacterized protein LOC131446656 n=1 Tax=Solea solea TaxID=90069 RepID=UPI0027295476|nr:uncharacterized protein LOC131446656 [Solea solea]